MGRQKYRLELDKGLGFSCHLERGFEVVRAAHGDEVQLNPQRPRACLCRFHLQCVRWIGGNPQGGQAGELRNDFLE